MLQQHEISSVSAVLVGDESLLVSCGRLLLESGITIRVVITQSPDVAAWANGLGIATDDLTPGLANRLAKTEFDWLFSIANLRIIPDDVVRLARQSAINFHDGPLPKYAGVNAPVWALMNDEKSHGVTWHEISGGIDEGAILSQQSVDISPGETAFSLNSKCYAAGLESFEQVLEQVLAGKLNRREQDFTNRTNFTRDQKPAGLGLLDFNGPSSKLTTLVNALDHAEYWNPVASAKILIGGKLVLVGSACEVAATEILTPGTVVDFTNDGITVATTTQNVNLSRLTDGKGHSINPADVIEIGDVLDSGSLELAKVNATVLPAVKGEGYWRKVLTGLRPIQLPFSTVSKQKRVSSIELSVNNAQDLERLVATVAAWASCSVDEPVSDIAYASPETLQIAKSAKPLVNSWVPLRVERSDDENNLQAGAFLQSIKDQLDAIKTKPAFLSDLPARDPAVQGFRVPDVGISVSGDGLIDESVITVDVDINRTNCRLYYDAARIPEHFARVLADRLEHFVNKDGLADSSQGVSPASVLGLDEGNTVLTAWNETKAEYDRTETIHGAFAKQAAITPDDVAVVYEDKKLTYAELDARSNQVAHVLRSKSVAPNQPVAICLRRSTELLIAALGVLKAGGAYVPLDPAYPENRLAHYVTNSASKIIIAATDTLSSVPSCDAEVLQIDAKEIKNASIEPVKMDAKPSDLAYLIYTSGSTGTPKGVMVTHANVVNFFAGMDQRVEKGENAVWLAVTSLSFDISVLELFYTIARGYTVVIAGDTDRTVMSNQEAFVSDKKIDFSLFYWGNDGGEGSEKYKLLLEGAKFADANGFNAIWTPERHFHDFGGAYPNPSVTGAAVAAVTKQIGVRAGSCVAPLHHTARIAEEWAVIDNMTNGRAGLAIASGWQPDDFVLRPENTPPSNKSAMFDAITDLRKLWKGEAVEFPTKSGGPHAVVTQPRPISTELPLWVTTAGNPETWKEAGAIGANVLTHLLGQSIEEVQSKIKIYHSALIDAGHDPANHSVSLMLHSFVGADRETVRETVREPMKDYLRSAAGLIKQYAWAFPAFKKPKGVEQPFQIDLASLNDDEMEGILEFAFQRYFEDAGLFGTVNDCVKRVEELKAIGVTEIACLIDFGISTDKVLDGLSPLSEVLRLTNSGAVLRPDDFSLAAQIIRHKVTHLQCTPSMAQILVQDEGARSAASNLEHLLVGGEALPASLARDLKLSTDAKLLNMYGPTETTIWSLTDEVRDPDGVTIGTPIANTQVYVLDEKFEAVPIGVAGELYIAGDGVTKGYFGLDALTATRFVDDPFAKSGKMYRTGDLVRWNASGQIEFLGRTDHQVKIRGHRIELGEIEAALDNLPKIQTSVVVPKEEGEGDTRLLAFVKTTGEIEESRVLSEIGQRLPPQMVPSAIAVVDAFPLTPNKKIDRKALAELRIEKVKNSDELKTLGQGTEKTIANIWGEVLGMSSIGREDSFFALGGHSLLAVQVHRKLKDTFPSADLSITDIFSLPKLCDLAARIDGTGTETPAKSDKPKVTSINERRRQLRALRKSEAA